MIWRNIITFVLIFFKKIKFPQPNRLKVLKSLFGCIKKYH